MSYQSHNLDSEYLESIEEAVRRRTNSLVPEEAHLRREFEQLRFYAYDTLSSTMDVAAQMFALSSVKSPLVVTARTQNAGRGRAGRSWTSQKDAGLYVTFALPTSLGVRELASFPLAIGVAVLNTVEYFGATAALKWPNDVLGMKDRNLVGKLSGILLERSGEQEMVSIGIGINLSRGDEGVSLLELTGKEIAASEVLADLSLNILAARDAYQSQGLRPFLKTWNSKSVLNGKEVHFTRDFKRCKARALAVEEDGSLRVQTDVGEERVYAGDVDLVRFREDV